jgi:hypothetical protein
MLPRLTMYPHISTVKQNMSAGNHLFATNDITLVCMSRYLCMDVTHLGGLQYSICT